MKDKIREKLISLSDEKYKEFHSGLCPNTNNIIGVRVPLLRSFAKELVQENWREYLEEAQNEYYEEIMLQGMVIGLAKMSDEERISYIQNFVPKIDNWAICDVFCAGLKFTNKNLELVWKLLDKYLKSDKEFEIRFGVVMLLDFYIRDEYIEKVLDILNNISHEGYYVKMAVAWAISIAYIKYPNETLILLKNNKLDDFTYNKAIQKIIESYRVSEKDKQTLKNMKRK